MLPDRLIYIVGHASFTDMCDCFSKLKQSSLFIRKDRRLAPYRDQQQFILIIPQLQQILGVHIQTEGAAVQLRYPYFDQFSQELIAAPACGMLLQRHHCPESGRVHFSVIESQTHHNLLLNVFTIL
ncbi:hypothetical protein D3C71_1808200 [compost metagenome]